MNYEKAKDRIAAAKPEVKPRRTVKRDPIGPALPEGMISARQAKSRYFVTDSELQSWKGSGTIGRYSRGYSEREIQAAVAARNDLGIVDGKRRQRNGQVRVISPIKNRHFIG